MHDIALTIRNLLLVGLISFGMPLAGCYSVDAEDDDADFEFDADVDDDDEDDVDIEVDD
jgi:hypothetical protein